MAGFSAGEVAFWICRFGVGLVFRGISRSPVQNGEKFVLAPHSPGVLIIFQDLVIPPPQFLLRL